jgi:hypothetical protein
MIVSLLQQHHSSSKLTTADTIYFYVPVGSLLLANAKSLLRGGVLIVILFSIVGLRDLCNGSTSLLRLVPTSQQQVCSFIFLILSLKQSRLNQGIVHSPSLISAHPPLTPPTKGSECQCWAQAGSPTGLPHRRPRTVWLEPGSPAARLRTGRADRG